MVEIVRLVRVIVDRYFFFAQRFPPLIRDIFIEKVLVKCRASYVLFRRQYVGVQNFQPNIRDQHGWAPELIRDRFVPSRLRRGMQVPWEIDCESL